MAELKWLEDLHALMEERSFTKAAQRRFVTQPAFSRRIRLLEEWLGIELVDRSRKPIGILPLVHEHELKIRELINNFYRLRNDLQHSSRELRTGFVAQHTLAVSHFPALIRQMQPALPGRAYRLHTANNEECPALFTGDNQFILCYQRPKQPLLATDTGILHKRIAQEQLIPVAQQALFNATLQHTLVFESRQHILPVLMFIKGGFLAEVLQINCLPAAMRDYPMEIVCESAFAVSLKEMALAGMGIAWLPEGLVRNELANRSLIPLTDWLGSCALDVVLYYRKDSNADEAFERV